MNSENDRDVYYLIQKRVMISGEELIDANPDLIKMEIQQLCLH